jgi:hypothetical protein
MRFSIVDGDLDLMHLNTVPVTVLSNRLYAHTHIDESPSLVFRDFASNSAHRVYASTSWKRRSCCGVSASGTAKSPGLGHDQMTRYRLSVRQG